MHTPSPRRNAPSAALPPHIRNVTLAGFMGSGKSTVGKIMAARLGWEFIDTDRMIIEKAGKSISEIFEQEGEEAFREMESALARELPKLNHHGIATGGGLVLREENRKMLEENGPLVFLETSPDEIWKRVRNSRHRPLLDAPDPKVRIESLLKERDPVYRSIKLKVCTDGLNSRSVAKKVIQLLERN